MISENTDDVIWIYDTSGQRFTYTSDSVKKLRGFTQQEALSQSIAEKLAPESLQYVTEQIPKRIAEIESGNFTLKTAKDRIFQLHKNGSIIPTEVITNFVTDDKGKVIKLIGISRDISENIRAEEIQKKATAALQNSRNQLQAVLDTSLDAITLTNEDGIFLACNKTLLKRWNKPKEEILNQPASVVLPPDIFADRLDKVRKCISTKTFMHFIDSYDGHYFENTISPVIETNGTVKTVSLFSHDITEKKLAELKLQKERDLLENILESMTDAFVSLDENWCYTYMNKNAGKIFNRNPREMIGKHIWTEFPEGVGQPFHLNYERAMREQVNIHFEEYYAPYDRWFENRIYPSNNGLAIFFQDITERKKAEESLTESEARYRFLFEHNPLPMLIYELRTMKLLSVNEAFSKHYGYDAEEIQNLLLTDLYPEEEKKAIADLVRTLKGHVNVGEWHHIKKDGTIITIIAQSHDINYMGKASRVAVITDITDRKLVELEILRLNRELEQRVSQRTSQLETAYKDMESFSYSVSHDLRAPLRAITGFSEIIARRYRAGLIPEVQHYLDNITKASKRMGLLIDDLLIYSRLGRQGVTLIPIDLKSILQPIENEFSISLKEINGKLEIQNNLPMVKGDRSLLHRIFINLIDNAVKYRNVNIPLVIEISAECCDLQVKILVKDNGIGIAQEHHKRIFNIFQRLHNEDKYPGTGIGLSTVKKSVELLNGTVTVESEPEKGSTFILELSRGD